MARLTSNITFTGSIGNLTAYKTRGSGAITLRTKGGPSKEQIKTAPNFINTRRNNRELGGRSSTVKAIRKALGQQKIAANYNIASELNKLLQPIQQLDTVSEWGQRSICISRRPDWLAGFQLNTTPFDTVVKSPILYTLSRETLRATVDLPALLPGINLQVADPYPFYSMMVSLAVVPDLFFKGDTYSAPLAYDAQCPVEVGTDWYPLSNGSPATRLELSLSTPPVDAAFSLVLAVGIRLGTMSISGIPYPVKRAGAAKIVAVV